jgi:hypothetical protein
MEKRESIVVTKKKGMTMNAKIVLMVLALGVGYSTIRADIISFATAVQNLTDKSNPQYIDAKVIKPLKDAAANKSPVMGLHSARNGVKELRDYAKDLKTVVTDINSLQTPSIVPTALKAIKFPAVVTAVGKVNDGLDPVVTLLGKFDLLMGQGELYTEKQYKELQAKLTAAEKQLETLKKERETCEEELAILKGAK